MSTVKITDLPTITTINANTSNTVLVGVDIPTNITGQMTLTTLAAGLYSNNNLVVGNNYTILPNVVGQFTGNSASYIQVNIENQTSSGSGDFVVTADDGTDTDHYVDLGFNGSTYSDPTFSAVKAHDGYLFVASSGINKGNLAIGTTNSTGKVNFVVGGLETANIVGYIDSTGIWSNSINSVVTANAASANSVINTRVSANVATLRDEITANAASANSVINTRVSANVATLRGEITANAASANSVINTRITANISTANIFTQAAFDKANNALANTFGVATAGDFYMSGDGFVNGTFTLANSTFGATESAFTIKATATVQTPSQAGTMLHITGKPNTPSRIIFDSFSTDGSAYGIVAGRTARGTAASPTATQTGDILMRLAGNGWGSTGFAPLGVARIDIVATENYTDAARGSKIVFYNIVNGTNTVNQIASFNANTIEFTGTVSPEKGFIYVPTLLAGPQTAFSINFETTSLIKANVAADCAITLSNYVAGKVVEVWLTNTSGSNRTITHGCTATNSTENSTTFTMPATSSSYLRYFSIDGDNANTFVAVQHA
jgi:hypothetical protein